MNLIKVPVTVDNITNGDQLLRRFNLDTEKLTEVTVIPAHKQIPESTATLRYEGVDIAQFIGEKVDGWDGKSPMTLYFNQDGHFDHWEKTATGATAGTAA